MAKASTAIQIDENSTQERILRAAYDCFEEFGIAKTTIENIAQAAGVSRPTVYKYYPGKNVILDEISMRETWKVNAEVRRRLVKNDDFAEFLTDVLLLVVRLASANVYIRRMVESIEFQQASIAPGSLMQKLQRTWWASLFQQAMAKGQIASDITIDDIILWLGRAQSMLMIHMSYSDSDPATVRHMVRRFIVQPMLATPAPAAEDRRHPSI